MGQCGKELRVVTKRRQPKPRQRELMHISTGKWQVYENQTYRLSQLITNGYQRGALAGAQMGRVCSAVAGIKALIEHTEVKRFLDGFLTRSSRFRSNY